MAIRYWKGGLATAVAQVADATFGTYDVTTTRSITIGGVTISAADSGGTLTTALDALKVLLNASTHPYFSGITWTSDATKIYGTADTAGVPFVFLAAVNGGTGTCSNTFTITTAAAGPHNFQSAANWSDSTVPVSNDRVVYANGAVDCIWGLDNASVALDGLEIHKSYTGKIGLPHDRFTTTEDGETTNTTYAEYRAHYLAIEVTQADGLCEIGKQVASGTFAGSRRIKLDLGSNAATVHVLGTAAASADSGQPAVRLKANDSATIINIHAAPGGVGIAAESVSDTSVVATINVFGTASTTRVSVGSGCTLTTFTQAGGNNVLNAAATITTVTASGGVLRIEGDFTITTLNATGATIIDNHYKTGGNAVTTANISGGLVDTAQNATARTWNQTNLSKGGKLKRDPAVLTLTTLSHTGAVATLGAA